MPAAVVAGAIANKLGKAGEAWARLGWARGLESLGYETYLVERIDPARLPGEELATSQEARYFGDVARRFGFDGRAALLTTDAAASVGLPPRAVDALLERADVLVNVSGHLPLQGPAARARRRIYVDVDPGYTQLWHAQGLLPELRRHDALVTVGLAVGRESCTLRVSAGGWLATLPPVSLADWPARAAPPDRRFTTVGSWRGGYGRLEHDGRLYGLKAHEFRKILELPGCSAHTFELALDIDPADEADRAALLDAGWRLVDPGPLTADPDAYRSYIEGSAAEFSVAQGIYVETRCGWFSDRTAHYLASGRPALVQDTGLAGLVPTGRGLLTFRTLDEAAAGAEELVRHYPEHSRAARRFAEERLEAGAVVAAVLERAGATRHRP